MILMGIALCQATGCTHGPGAEPTDAGLVYTGNVVFVTSTHHRLDMLGGLDGADSICRARATEAGLPEPTEYVAFLSDSTTSAWERLGDARGWQRVDGRAFANTVQAIRDGELYYPVSLDERGAVTTDTIVATGSDSAASSYGGHCADWTEDELAPWGGNPRFGKNGWLFGSLPRCDGEWAFYCFGTSRSVEVPAPDHRGAVVFVTEGAASPTGGVAAMDALCVAEASSAGLSGEFVALVARDGVAATARVSAGDAPWVRPDGSLVAANLEDLRADALVAPISVTADGATHRGVAILGGAENLGDVGRAEWTCDDWSGVGTGLVMQGHSGSPHDAFRDESTLTTCTVDRPIYCVQVGADGPDAGMGCVADADCDDDNLCTVDDCDVLEGRCSNEPVVCAELPDPCYVLACDPVDGTCADTVLRCDDGDDCTRDNCNPVTKGCTNLPVVCDDGDPCTVNYCEQGAGCLSNPTSC